MAGIDGEADRFYLGTAGGFGAAHNVSSDAFRTKSVALGNLFGGIELRGIEYDNGELGVTVDRLALRWNPWALATARLVAQGETVGIFERK